MPTIHVENYPEHYIEGEIIYIDSFGNAFTNIELSFFADKFSDKHSLFITYKGMVIEFQNAYANAYDDALYAIINSNDYIELFVYKESASTKYDIKLEDKVYLHIKQATG